MIQYSGRELLNKLLYKYPADALAAVAHGISESTGRGLLYKYPAIGSVRPFQGMAASARCCWTSSKQV